jgi:hypothetical protein
MHYPTHSTSMLISVTGAHVTQVACLGWVDRHEDGLYRADVNRWGNVFSNETALCRMSDGSIFRVNEFRRIGHPGACGLSLYGTEASYEEQCGPSAGSKSRVWVTKNRDERECLDRLLSSTGVPARGSGDPMDKVDAEDGTHLGVSRVHDVSRLPRAFVGMSNGHNGSHQFLVDDFIRACVDRAVPPNNVWDAARYLIPGIIAHESASRNGEQLEVPDLGDAPK